MSNPNSPTSDSEALAPITENSAPRYRSIPKLASSLIKSGEEYKKLELEGIKYFVEVSSVNQNGAPICYSQNAVKYTNAPEFGGQNRTLIIVRADRHQLGRELAIFDAATGEFFGPRGDIAPHDAKKFAEALNGIDDSESETMLSEGEILSHAGKEAFIRNSVPLFFEELRKYGTRAADGGYLMDQIDKLFPLPKDFKSFYINPVPSDSRYGVEVTRTSDILHGLALAWHHNKNADVKEAFEALKNISPKLESAIRVEYMRLFTQSVAARTMRR